MALLSRYYPANYTEEQYLIEKRVVKHALFTSLSVLVILWLIKVSPMLGMIQIPSLR